MCLFAHSSPLQTNIGTTLGTRLRRCPESGPCNACLQGAHDVCASHVALGERNRYGQRERYRKSGSPSHRQEAAPLAVTRGAVTNAGSGSNHRGQTKHEASPEEPCKSLIKLAKAGVVEAQQPISYVHGAIIRLRQTRGVALQPIQRILQLVLSAHALCHCPSCCPSCCLTPGVL